MKSCAICFALIFASLFEISCGNNPAAPPDGTGVLKVLLTDYPAGYDAVFVTISGVAVYNGAAETVNDDMETTGGEPNSKIVAGEWFAISSGEQEFDLLKLTNGLTTPLGNQNELPAGHYTQLRFFIDEARVVIDGVNYDLKVPSGMVKFVSGFDIVEGQVTTLIVDFDASRSVRQTGNRQYVLQPVIRIIDQEAAGSIIGKVTNYGDFTNGLMAYAMFNDNPVASCKVNSENGGFTLCALAEGVYTVMIMENGGSVEVERYKNTTVQVNAGVPAVLAEITL